MTPPWGFFSTLGKGHQLKSQLGANLCKGVCNAFLRSLSWLHVARRWPRYPGKGFINSSSNVFLPTSLRLTPRYMVAWKDAVSLQTQKRTKISGQVEVKRGVIQFLSLLHLMESCRGTSRKKLAAHESCSVLLHTKTTPVQTLIFLGLTKFIESYPNSP